MSSFLHFHCSDETLEALSDAQVVAPAAQTVDLHSADHRNSYLYVFDYQTRFGDYPQVSLMAATAGIQLNVVAFIYQFDSARAAFMARIYPTYLVHRSSAV